MLRSDRRRSAGVPMDADELEAVLTGNTEPRECVGVRCRVNRMLLKSLRLALLHSLLVVVLGFCYQRVWLRIRKGSYGSWRVRLLPLLRFIGVAVWLSLDDRLVEN